MRFARALLVGIVMVAGCGDDEPVRSVATRTPAPTATPAPATATPAPRGPQTRAITAVIERYAAAVRSGDATTICRRLLSLTVLERVEQAGGDCERDLIARAIETGGPGYRVAVESVEVSGAHATARTRVTDRSGTQARTQPLIRERGRWTLAT